MKLSELIINPQSLGSRFLLVGVAPVYAYKDGARTNTISAYRYTVALPDKKMERIGVKIEGAKLIDEPEGFIEVSFKDLAVYLYYANREPQVAAKATGISVVNQKA